MKIFELERFIPSKLRRKIYRFLPLIRLFLLIGLVSLVIYGFTRALPWVWQKVSLYIKLPWQVATTVVGNPKPNLRNTDNRTNVLLLGIGGEGHKAADLTDSIVFVSVNLENGKTVFLSIPRDIWLDSLQAKINTAYHYGEAKKEGGGLALAKASVEEVTAQAVHYAVVLDFAGFVKAIDLVGGVEVEVERSFDDYKYPVLGKENVDDDSERYQHLHFDAGRQMMDGETALRFIRSRNAEGEEGSDFARSKRQQKVLLAFKDKLFSRETLLNPTRIKELMAIFAAGVETDIKQEEYGDFIKLLKKINQGEMVNASLGTDREDGGQIGEEGLLVNPKQVEEYLNQWVLVPKGESWKEVHEYVESLLKE